MPHQQSVSSGLQPGRFPSCNNLTSTSTRYKYVTNMDSVPGLELGALHNTRPCLILTVILGKGSYYYYSHLRNEEAEVQRGQINCSKSHNEWLKQDSTPCQTPSPFSQAIMLYNVQNGPRGRVPYALEIPGPHTFKISCALFS